LNCGGSSGIIQRGNLLMMIVETKSGWGLGRLAVMGILLAMLGAPFAILTMNVQLKPRPKPTKANRP
jgi:hypothetical protein